MFQASQTCSSPEDKWPVHQGHTMPYLLHVVTKHVLCDNMVNMALAVPHTAVQYNKGCCKQKVMCAC